ncbi:MAG: cation-translocating P-type ATPase [Nitrospirota bacterium]|nr:cation-translocating P-type ATPase [Nitrospirota bacterium]
MKESTLIVKGMDCPSCVNTIEQTLRKEPGIAEISVNLVAEKATVVHDENLLPLADLMKKIKALGYEVEDAEVLLEKGEHTRSHGEANLGIEWIRLAVVGILVALSWSGVLQPFTGTLDVAIFAIAIGIYPFLGKCWRTLKARAIDADLFMTLGVTAATAIGEFLSAAVIAFFMLIAEMLEQITSRRSRKALADLIDTAPETARVKRNGKDVEVPVAQIHHEDIVLVRSGDKVPVDGIITSGSGSLNQAPITGESIPVDKGVGDEVYAGTINQSGAFQMSVLRKGKDTTLGRIIELVEKASANKAPVQRVADRFAAWFTPAILVIAGGTWLITGKLISAITVLVVACPCTVALATPLAVVAGIGKASRRGILIKGGRHLETLGKVHTVIFDKTGTLTMGEPRVTDIRCMGGFCDTDVLQLAAIAEKHSAHPLAGAILKKAREMGLEIHDPTSFETHHGKGVRAQYGDKTVAVGTLELLKGHETELTEDDRSFIRTKEEAGETVLLVSCNGRLCGAIAVADVVREEAVRCVEALRNARIGHIIMLTGDNPRTAAHIAQKVGITEVHAGMLPEDKVNKVAEIVGSGRQVAMVGDGINDAPALARASVGIAMGAAGSAAAIEAADVALMADDLSKLPEAIALGQRAFGTIKQNLFLGITFNVIGITLAATGVLTPFTAAVAHVIPDVLVFANSARLLR